MTPYFLLAWSVAVLLGAALVVVLAARWLGRQTERDEHLRLKRWLAIFELDTELLFETDNESRIRMHAKADRPLRRQADILRQAHDTASRRPADHNLACLDHMALQGELNTLFET